MRYLRSSPPNRIFLPGIYNPTKERNGKPLLYLTFDDGPVPSVTDQLLDLLDKHSCPATFFILGKQLESNPQYSQILFKQGHSIANHGYEHLDGFKTSTEKYLLNYEKGKQISGSPFFRPPYGRIRRIQARAISSTSSIVLWNILSGDFDNDQSVENILQYSIKKSIAGSVIVFHDSFKAAQKMLEVLPEYISSMQDKGFTFEKFPKER